MQCLSHNPTQKESLSTTQYYPMLKGCRQQPIFEFAGAPNSAIVAAAQPPKPPLLEFFVITQYAIKFSASTNVPDGKSGTNRLLLGISSVRLCKC